MKQAATADGDRPVYSLRTSRTRMDRVAARAHNLGLPDRNAGIEAALEAWTDDADADAPVSLKDILDEVRALRKQVNHLTSQPAGGPGGSGNQFGPPRTAVPDATLKFMSTDPEDVPDVKPYPVPAKRSRAKPRS